MSIVVEQQRRALRLSEVIAITGKSRPVIYKDVAAGSFPKPFKIGARAVAWDSVEIEQWLADRLASRDEAAR